MSKELTNSEALTFCELSIGLRWRPRDAVEREENHVNWCCGALHYWVGQGLVSKEKSQGENNTIVKKVFHLIIVVVRKTLGDSMSASRRDDDFSHSEWYLFVALTAPSPGKSFPTFHRDFSSNHSKINWKSRAEKQKYYKLKLATEMGKIFLLKLSGRLNPFPHNFPLTAHSSRLEIWMRKGKRKTWEKPTSANDEEKFFFSPF